MMDRDQWAATLFHGYGGRHDPPCALCKLADKELGPPKHPWVVNNPFGPDVMVGPSQEPKR